MEKKNRLPSKLEPRAVDFIATFSTEEEISEFLKDHTKVPYLVVDAQMHVINMGNIDTQSADFLKNTADSGYLISEYIKEILDAAGISRLPDEFCEEVVFDGKKGQLFISAPRRGQLRICILIAMRLGGALTDKEKDELRYISNIYCIAFRILHADRVITSEYNENIFRDFVEGRYKNKKEMLDKFNKLNIKQDKYFYVLSITYIDSLNGIRDTFARPLRSYIDQFTNIFHNSVAFIHREQLVVVFSTDMFTNQVERKLKTLNSFAKKEGLVVSCSNAVSDVDKIALAYEQCQECLNKLNSEGIEKSNIKMFYKFALRLLYQQTDISKDPYYYCHPAIQLLNNYDKEEGTEYSKTLFVYLKNCLQQSASSEELKIHRNTLSGRLDKIIDLTGINLQNGTELAHIMVSFEMEKGGYGRREK